MRRAVLRLLGELQVPLNAQVNTSAEPSPTPGRSYSLNTSSSNSTPQTPGSAAAGDAQQLPEGTILPPGLSVASFTAAHTTEDQASMDAIVSADNARRRQRHQWAYEESSRTNTRMLTAGHQPALLPAPSAEADAGAAAAAGGATEARREGHPALVITLPDDGGASSRRIRRTQPLPVLRSSQAPGAVRLHTPKSALYYPPGRSLPLSAAERRLMSAGAPPQTIAAHTRFAPADAPHSGAESPSTLASTPSRLLSESPRGADAQRARAAGGGGDAAPRLASESPGGVAQIGGVGVMRDVASPSPAALSGVAPIMTWGEVGATPMVLDELDLLHGSNGSGGGARGILRGGRSTKELAADKARRELAGARSASASLEHRAPAAVQPGWTHSGCARPLRPFTAAPR
jgi:Nuclear protein Es2